MNPARVVRENVRRFTDLPNIGPAAARDFELLGYREPAQLAGADPLALYRSLCATTGARHDPCVLDVFMSVTQFLDGGAAEPWWNFTEQRKRRYGDPLHIDDASAHVAPPAHRNTTPQVDAGHVRSVALALPDAVEAPHFDFTSFRVHRRIFATLPPDNAHLHVFVDEEERLLALAMYPQAIEPLQWGRKVVGLRVALGDSTHELVRHLLTSAWRHKAPKRLAATLA